MNSLLTSTDTTVTYQIEQLDENDGSVDKTAGGVVVPSRCDVMQCKVLDIVSWDEFEEVWKAFHKAKR